jgi:hypothetical protein
MSRVAVVVPIKPGMYEAARSLVETGPPFRLEDTPLEGHCVYLTEHEAVFVFEGPDARAAVEHLVGDAEVWQAATAWRECLAGKPRVADIAFAWHKGGPDPLHVPGL